MLSVNKRYQVSEENDGERDIRLVPGWVIAFISV
jgi:hypothetical protein